MHCRGYIKTYKWHGFGKLVHNCQCHNLHTLRAIIPMFEGTVLSQAPVMVCEVVSRMVVDG